MHSDNPTAARRAAWPEEGSLHLAPAPAAALTLCTLLAFAALVVAWRRLAGGLAQPLPTAGLAVAGLAAATAAAAASLLVRSDDRGGSPPWLGRGLPWAGLVSLSILGASLAVPRTPSLGLAVLWTTLLAGATCVLWKPAPRPAEQPPTRAPAARPAAEGLRYDPPQNPQPSSLAFLGMEVAAEDVVQQLTRSHGADGSDVLAGWLRVDLATGQRIANLHVAFCPPFEHTPQLAVEQLGGPPARIKTTQLLPYGARFDLKLDQVHASPSSVLLRFAARSAPIGHEPAGDSAPPTEPA